ADAQRVQLVSCENCVRRNAPEAWVVRILHETEDDAGRVAREGWTVNVHDRRIERNTYRPRDRPRAGIDRETARADRSGIDRCGRLEFAAHRNLQQEIELG